jgi:plastocyanin
MIKSRTNGKCDVRQSTAGVSRGAAFIPLQAPQCPKMCVRVKPPLNEILKRRERRAPLNSLLCAAALLISSCAAPAATFIVNMSGVQFVPGNLTIDVGDTVVWVNQDFVLHDTVSGVSRVPSGIWQGPLLQNGGSFSFTFDSVAPGTYPYYCTPHAFAPFNMIGSITVRAANQPPTVTILSPSNGAAFPVGASIVIQAAAADSDGSVARVDFFANGASIGVSIVPPYTATLANAASGSYALSAVAVDNLGAASTSAVVNVSVAVSDSPSIVIPPQSQSVVVGTHVTFTVIAAGTPPLSYQWQFNGTNLPGATGTELLLQNVQTDHSGQYSVAVSNAAGSITSLPATLTVTEFPNAPPIVSLISPANGAFFPLAAGITAVAEAEDSDDSIAFVEFLIGTSVAGIASNPPFAVILTNLPPGEHAISARAMDDRGAMGTSDAHTITILVPPSITLTQPAPGQLFLLGASVPLDTLVTPLGAQITTEFFANATGIGTDPVWVPLIAGPYTLFAVAVDQAGQRATSGPVSIRVFIPELIKPTVTVTQSPPDFARVSGTVLFAGVAADETGLERIEIQVNNGPVIIAEGTTHWRAEISVPPGNITVRVRSVDLAGNVSAEVTRFFTYVVPGAMIVQTRGAGTVTPDLNGRVLEIGKVYTIEARPGAGHVFHSWEGVPNTNHALLSFVMQSNLVLTANFIPNPFIRLKGAYTGLFFDTNNIAPDSSGFFRLQLAKAGAFSGKLMLNGRSHSFRGKLDSAGQAVLPVLRRGHAPLVVTLRLDVSGDSNQIEGSVTDGQWTAALLANRNVFHSRQNPAPHRGQSTFALWTIATTGEEPAGSGKVKISAAGSTHVRGELNGRRKLSLTSALGSDGVAPIYVTFRKFDETLIGWMAFVGGGVPSGELVWMRAGTDPFSVRLRVEPQ